MNTKIPLLFAAVFAIVAIYGIIQYLQSQRVTRDNVTIIVAKFDIHEGDEITRDFLTTKTIDASGYTDAMIRSGQENAFIGYRALMTFTSGDPILVPGLTLERAVKEPLAPLIEEGLRAISIPVSGVSAVAQLVEPGDHVDVLLTLEIPKVEEREINLQNVQNAGNVTVPTRLESKEPATIYVLQDATVLATGKEVVGTQIRREFAEEIDLGYDSVTVAVTPEEAPVIAFAIATGGADSFVLLLRNPTDDGVLEQVQVTNYATVLDTVKLGDLLKRRQTRRQVEVYEGGERARQ